jgi:hypothetical protein
MCLNDQQQLMTEGQIVSWNAVFDYIESVSCYFSHVYNCMNSKISRVHVYQIPCLNNDKFSFKQKYTPCAVMKQANNIVYDKIGQQYITTLYLLIETLLAPESDLLSNPFAILQASGIPGCVVFRWLRIWII